jgi:hypothetical protein
VYNAVRMGRGKAGRNFRGDLETFLWRQRPLDKRSTSDGPVSSSITT